MAAPSSLIEGKSIPSPADDFRKAQRIEQYRASAQALYIPAGFRWNYIPVSAMEDLGESHRSVTAGHCVTVTERRPSLFLRAGGRDFELPLEKPDSAKKLLAALKGEG